MVEFLCSGVVKMLGNNFLKLIAALSPLPNSGLVLWPNCSDHCLEDVVHSILVQLIINFSRNSSSLFYIECHWNEYGCGHLNTKNGFGISLFKFQIRRVPLSQSRILLTTARIHVTNVTLEIRLILQLTFIKSIGAKGTLAIFYGKYLTPRFFLVRLLVFLQKDKGRKLYTGIESTFLFVLQLLLQEWYVISQSGADWILSLPRLGSKVQTNGGGEVAVTDRWIAENSVLKKVHTWLP